jgi:hypothetical protein
MYMGTGCIGFIIFCALTGMEKEEKPLQEDTIKEQILHLIHHNDHKNLSALLGNNSVQAFIQQEQSILWNALKITTNAEIIKLLIDRGVNIDGIDRRKNETILHAIVARPFFHRKNIIFAILCRCITLESLPCDGNHISRAKYLTSTKNSCKLLAYTLMDNKYHRSWRTLKADPHIIHFLRVTKKDNTHANYIEDIVHYFNQIFKQRATNVKNEAQSEIDLLDPWFWTSIIFKQKRMIQQNILKKIIAYRALHNYQNYDTVKTNNESSILHTQHNTVEMPLFFRQQIMEPILALKNKHLNKKPLKKSIVINEEGEYEEDYKEQRKLVDQTDKPSMNLIGQEKPHSTLFAALENYVSYLSKDCNPFANK